MEWAALEMVRVDTPGFLQFLADRCEPRPSLRERVERELESFTVLLAERLVSFAYQSELIQPRIGRFEPVASEGELYRPEKVSGRSEDEETSSCFNPCGARSSVCLS
jgi:hypothetical protein